MVAEKKQINTTMLLIWLVAFNILLSLYVSFFKNDALSLETLKVGGAENMRIATQLYKLPAFQAQGKQQLEQGLQMYQWTADTTADATQPTADTTTAAPADTAKFAAIEKDGYIKGNKNARITIIEYSDMLCPYCKKHYNAQTIENLVAKYPNDVNMVFRQMPLPQLHPTAPIWAQGAICVGEMAGADKYYAYLAKAFQLNDFTEANVTDIAVSLWVNKAKFATCLTSEKTIARVAAEVKEGNAFGINGTPGNLVVDNQKGTFTLIAGAYPTETFEAEITKILGK